MIDTLEPRRLFASFAPTPTFGDRGAIVLDHAVDTLLRLADGTLMTLYRSGDDSRPYKLNRYTPAGLDAAFGDHGTFALPADSQNMPQLLATAKGRLIVAHETSDNTFALLRFKAGGGFDRTFNRKPLKLNASVQADAVGVALDRFQNVYLGVTVRVGKLAPIDYRIYRFKPDGTLDTNYGSGGYARAFSSTDGTEVPITIQPDADRTGAIFALLGKGRDAIVRKLPADGLSDDAFGTKGTARFLAAPDPGFGAPAYATGLRIDAANRPLVAAVDSDDYPTMYLTRLKANGAVDTSFATAGRITLPTTKFASMEESLYDEIVDFEVSRADGAIVVLTDDAMYRFTADGQPAAGTGPRGRLDFGRSDSYPAFGKASAAAAIGVVPAINQFDLGEDGRLFAVGNVYIRSRDDGSSGDTQTRLIELAARPDALLSRKTLYINGSEGSDRIRITAADGRVTLVRNGVTTTFAPGKVLRVQVDLRVGPYTERPLYDDVRIGAGVPAVVFGGPRVDHINTVAPSVIVAGNEDFILTGDGDDTLYLTDGGDGRVATGGGDDTVVSTSTFASLAGLDLGAGNDRLEINGNEYAEHAAGLYKLGDGDDRVTLHAFSLAIDAGRGADRFIAGGYYNTLLGGAGDDSFDIADQSNRLDGGDGNDSFVIGLNGLRNTVIGGTGNDVLSLVQDAEVKGIEKLKRVRATST